MWATANVSMWMNDVAAAWLMTTLTTSATMVALVQTASSLPVFLLGLPSGALADIVDRRRLFMFTQVWVAVNAAVLYVAAVLGALDASVLLLLVFVNGIGLAMRWPVYAAILPELVSRAELGSALALNGVAVNTSRVVGPVLAGFIIAWAGTEYVFALNFALSLAAALALFLWKRREKPPSVLPGERFLGAMRLGWQYVRESRRMRDALVITGSFFMHSTALMALTPLVAQGLGGGARTYTLLLASLGLGAVVAATQIPRLRARFNRDQVALGGSAVMAGAIATVAFAPAAWLAAPAMFVGGMAWITVANSLTISAQLALPDWVRARGMSIYQMAIMGGSAGGALVWGRIAEWTAVPTSLALAAASLLAALLLTRGRVLEGGAEEDLTPAPSPYGDRLPEIALELEDGPVMVTLEYLIDPARAPEFEVLMAESRSARLRQGAVSWGLFEDVEVRGRFIEYFACDSWADYLRRFERFTAQDVRLQSMRYAFHLGDQPPRIARYIARHPPAR